MSDAASIAREYNDAWNRRDWARYRELLHPEYTYTGGDGQAQKGQDAGLAVGQMFATAFPDGRIDVQSIHAAGNIAIVEFIGRGTHKGDLMGIAPTGRQISIPVCEVYELRDGKIHSERQYMDMLHMMQQLGVAPAPATA
jgi:steroid delta-isomerase-like uncharacterized protein